MVNESKNMYIPEDTLENHQGNFSICLPSVWKLCVCAIWMCWGVYDEAVGIIMGMTRGCTLTYPFPNTLCALKSLFWRTINKCHEI